jgi:TPR repeat protein
VAAGPLEDALAAANRGDYATALRLWRPLADQGNAKARYDLGVMYANGRGVPQDDAEAAKWFRLAADQRYASAQNNVGAMYYEGNGVPQDYVRAYMWFNLSAAQGDKEAAKNRDITAQRMTPAQIAEAQNLERKWKPRLDEQVH